MNFILAGACVWNVCGMCVSVSVSVSVSVNTEEKFHLQWECPGFCVHRLVTLSSIHADRARNGVFAFEFQYNQQAIWTITDRRARIRQTVKSATLDAGPMEERHARWRLSLDLWISSQYSLVIRTGEDAAAFGVVVKIGAHGEKYYQYYKQIIDYLRSNLLMLAPCRTSRSLRFRSRADMIHIQRNFTRVVVWTWRDMPILLSPSSRPLRTYSKHSSVALFSCYNCERLRNATLILAEVFTLT
jgi:hypothetical protein